MEYFKNNYLLLTIKLLILALFGYTIYFGFNILYNRWYLELITTHFKNIIQNSQFLNMFIWCILLFLSWIYFFSCSIIFCTVKSLLSSLIYFNFFFFYYKLGKITELLNFYYILSCKNVFFLIFTSSFFELASNNFFS